MKKAILTAAALAIAGFQAFAQQQPAGQAPPAAQASGSPVAKQPAPKSQAEGQALQAMFGATDGAARMKAVDEFIVKFPDSEFKAFALMIAAETARQGNDHEKSIIYAERALEADSNSYMSMIILATELAGTTREHDLDREEKLKRAEKYATQAIELIKNAPRPRPDVTDEQWAQAKKEFESQAHVALGAAQLVRKNCDGAISELNTAASGTNDPGPSIRLGMAYNQCGKPDQAIATFDKVLAMPELPPQFKQFAEQEKQKAVQRKGGAAAPAAPAAGTAPASPAAPKP
jgi:tetratricopeptide (TPR) repeat protein